MKFRWADNLLPEKADGRNTGIPFTPHPGTWSDHHRERSFRHCGGGALCKGKLVRQGYNKATLERTSHSIFVYNNNFAPAQRDLRESHSVS